MSFANLLYLFKRLIVASISCFLPRYIIFSLQFNFFFTERKKGEIGKDKIPAFPKIEKWCERAKVERNDKQAKIDDCQRSKIGYFQC